MKESSTLLFQPPYSSVAALYIGMFQNRGAQTLAFLYLEFSFGAPPYFETSPYAYNTITPQAHHILMVI